MRAVRHETVDQTNLVGFTLIEIAPEVKVEVKLGEGRDTGFHSFGNDWWSNLKSSNSFQYLSLDSLYPPNYFVPEIGHPNQAMAKDLYQYMQSAFEMLFGRHFSSVLELGTGGGEITQNFQAAGLDYVAVEGTTAGVEKLRKIGIPADRIIAENLKFMSSIERRFDIVMCTEVAEHVEPFFASKIVENCIRHSDVVWFSSADRNRPAHYHHCNEQDIEVWDNLFAHMGFPFLLPLDGRLGRASRIYLSKSVGRQLSA